MNNAVIAVLTSMNESTCTISACVRLTMKGFTQAMACERILGLECWKNCRNLGISTFTGRCSASLSSNSAESSHIFCSALNAPYTRSNNHTFEYILHLEVMFTSFFTVIKIDNVEFIEQLQLKEFDF